MAVRIIGEIPQQVVRKIIQGRLYKYVYSGEEHICIGLYNQGLQSLTDKKASWTDFKPVARLFELPKDTKIEYSYE